MLDHHATAVHFVRLERRALGRDLHDRLAQSVAALHFRAQATAEDAVQELVAVLAKKVVLVVQQLCREEVVLPASACATRADLYRLYQQQAEVSSRQIRGRIGTGLEQLCDSLAPEHPLHKPTCECLRDLARVLERPVSLRQSLQELVEMSRLPVQSNFESLLEPHPWTSLLCYRIAQEALGNANRHSRASQLFFKVSTDEKGLEGELLDDGRGFETLEGAGLEAMRFWASLGRGHLSMRSTQEGTLVSWSLSSCAGLD